MKKWEILTMKRRKVVRCVGIKLSNTKVMKENEKEGYTYLDIVELDKIKENELKENTLKEYKRRLRLVLKSKLNRKNNSNKFMGSGYIQIWSRNATEERK